MEEMKDRIKSIIDHEGITAGFFASRIGVSQSTISHIMNGRNKNPSIEVLNSILDIYPYINPTWLLTGREEMMIDGATNETKTTPVQPYLFEDNDDKQPESTSTKEKEDPLVVAPHIIYKEAPSKQIKEIRVFFSDNTFEIFVPAQK